jgi:hypothetical protein
MRGEVTGECRKLYNEEPYGRYSAPHIILNEMGGACSTYEEKRGVHRVLVGKPEGKRLIGRQE